MFFPFTFLNKLSLKLGVPNSDPSLTEAEKTINDQL